MVEAPLQSLGRSVPLQLVEKRLPRRSVKSRRVARATPRHVGARWPSPPSSVPVSRGPLDHRKSTRTLSRPRSSSSNLPSPSKPRPCVPGTAWAPSRHARRHSTRGASCRAIAPASSAERCEPLQLVIRALDVVVFRRTGMRHTNRHVYAHRHHCLWVRDSRGPRHEDGHGPRVHDGIQSPNSLPSRSL